MLCETHRTANLLDWVHCLVFQKNVLGTASLCVAFELWGARSELWSNLPKERRPRKPRPAWDDDIKMYPK